MESSAVRSSWVNKCLLSIALVLIYSTEKCDSQPQNNNNNYGPVYNNNNNNALTYVTPAPDLNPYSVPFTPIPRDSYNNGSSSSSGLEYNNLDPNQFDDYSYGNNYGGGSNSNNYQYPTTPAPQHYDGYPGDQGQYQQDTPSGYPQETVGVLKDKSPHYHPPATQGRIPGPLRWYKHPFRRPHRRRRLMGRPSKLHKWQRIIRSRFNNHLDQRRAYQVKTETEGRSVAESFMSSAMFPVSFLAFSMIFMDIAGRLMPLSPFGQPTTTTPPPKITKVEYNPPRIPTIGDLLGGVKDQFKIKKKKKKRKKKNYGSFGWGYDSSEELSYDPPPETRKRKVKTKKKTKKKKKYNSEPMTLGRLQELFVKLRPSFV